MFSSWRRRTVPSSMRSQPTPHSAARQLLPAPRRAALYREAAAPRRRRAHGGPRGSLRGTRTVKAPPGDSSAELSGGSQPAVWLLACLLPCFPASLLPCSPAAWPPRPHRGRSRAWGAAGRGRAARTGRRGSAALGTRCGAAVRQRAAGPCAGGCASPPCFQTVVWSAGTRAFWVFLVTERENAFAIHGCVGKEANEK